MEPTVKALVEKFSLLPPEFFAELMALLRATKATVKVYVKVHDTVLVDVQTSHEAEARQLP